MRFDVLRLHTRMKYCRRDDGREHSCSSIKRHTLVVTVHMIVERIALYERHRGSGSSER